MGLSVSFLIPNINLKSNISDVQVFGILNQKLFLILMLDFCLGLRFKYRKQFERNSFQAVVLFCNSVKLCSLIFEILQSGGFNLSKLFCVQRGAFISYLLQTCFIYLQFISNVYFLLDKSVFRCRSDVPNMFFLLDPSYLVPFVTSYVKDYTANLG